MSDIIYIETLGYHGSQGRSATNYRSSPSDRPRSPGGETAPDRENKNKDLSFFGSLICEGTSTSKVNNTNY